jgi:hypothetical protein
LGLLFLARGDTAGKALLASTRIRRRDKLGTHILETWDLISRPTMATAQLVETFEARLETDGNEVRADGGSEIARRCADFLVHNLFRSGDPRTTSKDGCMISNKRRKPLNLALDFGLRHFAANKKVSQ